MINLIMYEEETEVQDKQIAQENIGGGKTTKRSV